MTPAERARLIDQQEFEAESKAIRERALIYAKEKQKQEADLIDKVLTRSGLAWSRTRKRSARQQTSEKVKQPAATLIEPETIPLFKPNKTKPSHIFYEYQGKSMSMVEISTASGIPYMDIYQRLRRGWTMEAATTRPVKKKRRTLRQGAGAVSNFIGV